MYKQAGVRIFDQGGWYDGTTDEEKLRIVRNFDCHRPITMKGTLMLEARGLMDRVGVDRWKLPLLVRRALPQQRRRRHVELLPPPSSFSADNQPRAESGEKRQDEAVEGLLLEPVLHAQAKRESAQSGDRQRH